MKTERLEDLGRIRVLLEKLGEHDIFNFYEGRNKDFVEWFEVQTKEKQEDILHKMIYGISSFEESLSECILISRGDDD